MLYLSLDKNQLKLLYLKRSLLNQYEVQTFEKNHQVDLLKEGRVTDTDVVASAIKEALNSFSPTLKEKEVFLILPQSCFTYFRASVPADIAASAVHAFIKDKARSQLAIDLEESSYEYFIVENDTHKQINFFALDKAVLAIYYEVLNLVDLRPQMIMPDTLAYFKLFEKALRKDKKENIFYVTYSKEGLQGYLFDTFGLVSDKKWTMSMKDEDKIEDVLKDKVAKFENEGTKLNRVILSGTRSDEVRQDTFTKSVGVWTNPLKRIIPQFYEEYLKLLVSSENKPFPILPFDLCFGAFVFSQENKNFSFFKQAIKRASGSKFSLPQVNLPRKELIIFVVSFVASFGLFFLVSRMKLNFNTLMPKFETMKKSEVKSPVNPTSTPTPTPSIKKEELKIKILNGSGTRGKATDVKDILKNKGYGEILTGNADSFDFEKSELQVKKSKSDAVGVIKNDLKDNVASFKESVLAEKEAADVVIIVGKDFK